jgi:pimeloyl-ACP methyl ester carboxylesterase
MPDARANGVRLHYQRAGAAGPAIVLVHGSWVSHHGWDMVVPALADRFRVVAYDRRGHSESERPSGQGSVHEDVADLAALIQELDLAPAWVVGNSFGGSIALRLAGERPDLLRGVAAHEPPLFALLADDPDLAPALAEVAGRIGAVANRIAAGDHAGAAEQFVETVALGPGAWAGVPDEVRPSLIANAPSFLDEVNDPDQLSIDLGRVASFAGPVLLSTGGQSPPTFAPVVARIAAAIPTAEVVRFPDAGHIPHVTHPEAYLDALSGFIARHADR